MAGPGGPPPPCIRGGRSARACREPRVRRAAQRLADALLESLERQVAAASPPLPLRVGVGVGVGVRVRDAGVQHVLAEETAGRLVG